MFCELKLLFFFQHFFNFCKASVHIVAFEKFDNTLVTVFCKLWVNWNLCKYRQVIFVSCFFNFAFAENINFPLNYSSSLYLHSNFFSTINFPILSKVILIKIILIKAAKTISVFPRALPIYIK